MPSLGRVRPIGDRGEGERIPLRPDARAADDTCCEGGQSMSAAERQVRRRRKWGDHRPLLEVLVDLA